MKISDHLDKENLHHAYLIQGARAEVMEYILALVGSLGVSTTNNPDFCQITTDAFKMEEAQNLRQMGSEKSFVADSKRFFIVCANSFTLDAQQALLKMFEEPINNTHFFVIVPEIESLLKTLISRFYVVRGEGEAGDVGQAEKFIKMPPAKRIDFIKEFLIIENEEDLSADSPRARALKFLNTLETVLHARLTSNDSQNTSYFNQIFKSREFLRQPGSATKTLLESVALSLPTF